MRGVLYVFDMIWWAFTAAWSVIGVWIIATAALYGGPTWRIMVDFNRYMEGPAEFAVMAFSVLWAFPFLYRHMWREAR